MRASASGPSIITGRRTLTGKQITLQLMCASPTSLVPIYHIIINNGY